MDRPRISVIIPVLGEGLSIGGIVENLFVLGGREHTEVVVVDADPLGGTIVHLSGSGAVTMTAPLGRARQMNAGARVAGGDAFLFLHADTSLPVNGFELIRQAIASGCLAGAFDLAIASSRTVLSLVARTTSLRARLTRVPFGDQGIFMRADYFLALGGYAPIPIMEDVELMRRIRRRGDEITILPAKVHTSARRWEREGVVQCTLRNWALRLLFVLGVPPARLARFYQ
jgi:rSAM/selenodomain-associated transferase 2